MYLFYPLSIECVYMMFCKSMQTSRDSKSTCSRCTGGPGWLSTPSPCSVGGAGGGGGGGWQVMSCLGDLERGRGDLWQEKLAGLVRGWIWRVSTARHFGGSAWRVCLAGQVGSFIQRVFQSKKRHMLSNNEKK